MLGSALNLDSLLNSYKVDLTNEKPSLDPLVVLSDDEDINDYMEKTNETEPDKSPKSQIEAEQADLDVIMATEKDPKENDLTDGVEKEGSSLILPLMMVSF